MSMIEMLKQHESLATKVYTCPAGRLTIGYGRNLQDLGITEGEASLLLQNDITRCQNELFRALPWTLPLDSVRRDVLTMLIFNLGLPVFLSFTKMLMAIKSQDFIKAAQELMASRYASQVGDRCNVLSRMLALGKYPE